MVWSMVAERHKPGTELHITYIQKVNACFYPKLWDPEEQNSDLRRLQIFDIFWLWIITWIKWNGRKEKRGGVVAHGLTCNFAFPSLFPHFQSQYLISSHMLSHWVRNRSFSLPVSLLLASPLHSGPSLHTLPVGANEHTSLLSHSNHPLSVPMVHPVLLHHFSPLMPICQH